MKAIIAVALLAISASSAAYAATKPQPQKEWAQQPSSFLGINFSSNVVGDLPICPTSSDRYDQKELCYEKPLTENYFIIQGKPRIGLRYFYNLAVKVSGEQVEYFYLHVKSDDFDKLAEIFAQKYGAAHEKSISKIKTKSGAEFDNETLVWRGKSRTITLSKYDGDINTSSATISDNSLTARASAEQKNNLQNDASKL